jgi:hypothetical protein
MKKINLFLVVFLLTMLTPISVSFAQSGNCGYIETGYYKKIRGTKFCILDNSARHCIAIVDPCPQQ